MKARYVPSLILLILVTFSSRQSAALNITDTIKSFPFTETWDSANFTGNNWIFPYSQGNWTILTTEGNPSPCAAYTGMPSTANYIYALVTPWIDARGLTCHDFSLDFDLKLESIVNSGTETLSVMIEYDTVSNTLTTWHNNAGFDWTAFHFNISPVYNKLFRVRFVAVGQYSYQISGWFLDNISMTKQCRIPRGFTCYPHGECTLDYHLCTVNLFWNAPICNGQPYSSILQYDDDSYENGWSFYANNDYKIGNLFPVNPGEFGVIQSFDMEFQQSAGLTSPVSTTITVYDLSHNILGVTQAFVNEAGWVTVPAPDIPFSGPFYAMVDYYQPALISNFFNIDEDGPYSTYEGVGLAYYVQGGTNWGTTGDATFLGNPGVWMQRATCLISGKKTILGPDTVIPSVIQNNFSTDKVLSHAKKRDHSNNEPDSSLITGYLIYRLVPWEDTAFILVAQLPANDTIFTDHIHCIANYYIRAIYSDGCVSLPTNTITWAGCYSGVDEHQRENNFTIIPNPAADFTDINSDRILQKIDLINNVGSIIKSITGNRSKNTRISLGGVSPGLYFISVITDQGGAVKKLVVMHK